MAGATLLALEVVWFRFLQLFVYGTNLIFATMLAVVLLGIGAGAVIAARWLGRDPQAHRAAPLIALAAGGAVEICYTLFDPHIGGLVFTTDNIVGGLLVVPAPHAPDVAPVRRPLHAVGGRAAAGVRRGRRGGRQADPGQHAGRHVGALLAGFVLLPRLGVEKTLFAAAVAYGLIAGVAVIVSGARPDAPPSLGAGCGGGALRVGGALFPFGLMRRHFVPLVLERYNSRNRNSWRCARG